MKTIRKSVLEGIMADTTKSSNYRTAAHALNHTGRNNKDAAVKMAVHAMSQSDAEKYVAMVIADCNH